MPSQSGIFSISTQASPGVNHDLLIAVAQVNARLAALGVELSSGYRIAPALGGEIGKTAPSTTPHTANVAFQSIAGRNEAASG